MWNESISSTQAYIKQWFYDEQGANFIAARNNFEHVLISLWVTLKNFDEFLKLFLSLPCQLSHDMYHEDVLLMTYYHTGIS